MTTVLLIRHAEADSIRDRLLGWTPGIHLNQAGRAQLPALLRYLRRWTPAAVYTSPLERAAETAHAIAREFGVAEQTCDRLGEFRFGEWSGKTFRELDGIHEWRRFNTLRSAVRPPGGESMLEVQGRMTSELDRLARIHDGAAIAVVSHGDPIKAALGYWMGVPLDLIERIEIETASVSAAVLGAGAPLILMCGAVVTDS